MTAWKTRFRRGKSLLWTAFSILVILAAAGVGIGKLMMPYSDRYQPRLEAWLSKEFGRPVVVESFVGDWTAFGPRLSLQGLKLLPTGDGIDGGMLTEQVIESAALDIRPLNYLIPGLPLYRFRVIGADFELRHTADGRFELSGFGVSGRSGQSNALSELARVGEVRLQDSSLVYQDEKYGILLGFSNINGALRLKGEELAAEIRAQFRDARSGMTYGEIEAALLLTLDESEGLTGLAWQANASELMLAAFQGRLPRNPFLPLTGWLNAELWGDWTAAAGHSIRGVVDLGEARLVNDYQDLQLDRVNTRFRWAFHDRGDWELHLAELLFDDGAKSWVAPRIAMVRNITEGLGLWISADRLPLDVPLNLARDVMSLYGTPWPKVLPRSAAGEVSDLDLVLDKRWRLTLARGEIHDASVFDWGRWPDVLGLEGKVSLHRGHGRLDLQGESVRVDWPRMFRAPLEFTLPPCELDLKWGDGWQVGLRDCRLQNADLEVVADLFMSSNVGKPAVDLNAAVVRGDIARLGDYWPEAIMKDNVKNWLRRGLVSGDIVRGRFQIHGDMDNWPFRNGSGRFEALAELRNAVLDYYPGWPQAAGVEAVVQFEGAGMELRGRVADIGGISADPVHVDIPDLKAPLLTVDYASADSLPGLVRFLRQTPLQEQIRVDLDQFRFAGQARTGGRLVVPLGRSGGRLSVDGRVDLREGSFYDPVSDIALEQIAGPLNYDERGFSGNDLVTEYRGQPARLNLSANADRAEKFRAELVGVFDVRDVIPGFLLESYSELERIEGECLWNAAVTVEPGSDVADSVAWLTVQSVLQGVELDLPEPVNKPAGESWPLVLRMPLSGDSRLLDIALANRAMLRFDLPPGAEAPRSAALQLGPGTPPLPAQGWIRIDGRSDYVDLDGWLDIVIEGARADRGMGGLALEPGQISAGRLQFLDRHFEDVGLQFEALESEISAEFTGAAIEGKVRYSYGESSVSNLSAEFERLLLGDPISDGMDVETDPAELPALHLYARSFQYAGVDMGETRIEAYPTAQGFHFEKVDAASDQMTIQARGDWSLSDDEHRSDFEIHMAAESLGDFLQSMDISSSIQGGQTLVKFSAWWSGSPAAFALSRLNGEIEFSVVDGNITNASAGTGRLLGLLSVQALPRRLALDFRDVFDSGFSFDEASGTFRMENGTAHTDDVELKSSAASISISGKTDLVNQQYDQLLTIRPGLGNTLPIIGALAAGPGGAAAGLALQGLLQQSLGEATQVQYSITGDWAEPRFEAVDVKRVEPPAAVEQGNGGGNANKD